MNQECSRITHAFQDAQTALSEAIELEREEYQGLTWKAIRVAIRALATTLDAEVPFTVSSPEDDRLSAWEKSWARAGFLCQIHRENKALAMDALDLLLRHRQRCLGIRHDPRANPLRALLDGILALDLEGSGRVFARDDGSVRVDVDPAELPDSVVRLMVAGLIIENAGGSFPPADEDDKLSPVLWNFYRIHTDDFGTGEFDFDFSLWHGRRLIIESLELLIPIIDPDPTVPSQCGGTLQAALAPLTDADLARYGLVRIREVA